ncbi:MAG: glycosyltransferase family 2 protein [Proteobacteria bacterium]|nr:glycosyltransferase family 2 protein [Pseudomonadota bacterium]
MKLSVVIPVYNEKETILALISRVNNVPLEKEIIIIDDRSTDGTREILKNFSHNSTKILFHETNQGKGAALRTGFSQVQGDIVIIQDADLEYNPEEYPVLIGPILDGHADAVFGSRFAGGPHRVLLFWHYVGNKLLTTLSNMFTNMNLTDMETCYKAFRAALLPQFTIESNRFGIEPEITAKFARLRCRIYEVPISYSGRDYTEGKKIGWKDGLAAIYWIIYYNLKKSLHHK